MAWSSLAICSRLPLGSPIASSAPASEPPPPSSSHKPTFLPLPSLTPPPNFNSASIDRVVHPSLQFANLLWFKGTYNAQIFVGDSEPADSVVKRFRRAVIQAGVISECRRRRFFETPQDVKKRKRQAAQRKRSRRSSGPRPDLIEKKEVRKAVVDDDDDDNWEYDMQ